MHSYRWSRASAGLLLAVLVLAVALTGQLRRPAAVPAFGTELAVAQSSESASVDATGTYPLADLNKEFRAAYARTRQQIVTESGPIVLAHGDNVVLLRNGRRTTARYVPAEYHTLKAVCHIPLTIYALLFPGNGELDGKRLAELAKYRERISGVGHELERRLPDALLPRQRQIVEASQEFLDGVLKTKRASSADLLAFTGRIGPLVLADVADAARAELDALHKQVSAWRAELTPEEWRRLHIVVMGSAMPRKGNLVVQYFARLLREPGEGPRIVYAEAVTDEARAVQLLGTHLFDTDIGLAFFGDKHRMYRDLLEDAAEEYLRRVSFER